jgi:hypothetical protein
METRARNHLVVICVLAAALSACGESASKPAARTTTPVTVAPAAAAPATTPGVSVVLDCTDAVDGYLKMLVDNNEGGGVTGVELSALAMQSFNACTSAAAWSEAATSYDSASASGPNTLAATCSRVDPNSTSAVCASLAGSH